VESVQCQNNLLQVSFILEWENVKTSELARCKKMLRILAAQANAIRKAQPGYQEMGRFELFVLYDEQKLEPKPIEAIIRQEMGADNSDFKLQLIGAEGGQKQYYNLKNAGARLAGGDILVFIDSDVVPNPGWLVGMLAPFTDPDIQVVGGNCYIDPYNLYARTFGLFWFFPLKPEDSILRKAERFFANNVAFRKEVFHNHPFPAMPNGVARGSCARLAAELRQNGITIYRATSARVSHPPPPSFVKKALSNGRDRELRQREAGVQSLLRALTDFCRNVFLAIRNVVTHHHKVDMSTVLVPGAILIVLAYNSLSLVGQLMTKIAPEFMRKSINEY